MSTAVTTENQNPNALELDAGAMVPAHFDEKAAGAMVKSFDFLPQLKLCGASTDLAKEAKIGIGHFALVASKKEFIDLGKNPSGWVCAMRTKALAYKDNPVTVYYDPKTTEFQDIARRADTGGQESGCMYGFEFLVYLPDIQVSKDAAVKGGYVSFFLCSPSARNETPGFKSMLGKPVTFTPHLAENKKGQKWHVPKCLSCSLPLALPPDYKAAAARFVNAMPSSIKKADVADVGADAERVQ